MFSQSRGSNGMSELWRITATLLHLCCAAADLKPAFTHVGELLHTRGKTISWTVSPSTGHQENDTFTSILSPWITVFTFTMFILPRSCMLVALPRCIILPFLLTDKDDTEEDLTNLRWRQWNDGGDKEEPLKDLTLKMLLCFCLPIFYCVFNSAIDMQPLSHFALLCFASLSTLFIRFWHHKYSPVKDLFGDKVLQFVLVLTE